MTQILKFAVVMSLASAEDNALLQSKVEVVGERTPAPQGMLVEVATFTASSVLMTLAVLGFAQWAARDASSRKSPPPLPEEKGFAQFLQAVKAGDVELSKELLGRDPSFATRGDAWGATALHVAAASGASVVLQTLLRAAADINARDGFQETPLHLAASAGELCCLIALIDAGANVDATNSDGVSPLVVAAKANQKVACEMLLDHGASNFGSEACSLLQELLAERPEMLPTKTPCSTVSTTDCDTTTMRSQTASPCSVSSFLVPKLADQMDDGNSSWDGDHNATGSDWE